MLNPDRPRFADGAAPKPTSKQHAVSPSPLTESERAALVRRFVTQVGGMENARGALDLLAILTDSGESKPAQ